MPTTPTDVELLKLAAKAYNLKGHEWCDSWQCMALYDYASQGFDSATYWNPLRSDGDAHRLSAALRIDVHWMNGRVCTSHVRVSDLFEPTSKDPQAALRRAIVRVAAELGRVVDV